MGEPHRGQRLGGDQPVGPARPAYPADLAVTAHQHDLADGDRKIRIQDVGLRDVGDVLTGPGRCPAEYLDAASDDRDEPEDRLDQGRLAAPVRADEGNHVPRAHHPVHVLEDGQPAVGDAGAIEDHSGGGTVVSVHRDCADADAGAGADLGVGHLLLHFTMPHLRPRRPVAVHNFSSPVPDRPRSSPSEGSSDPGQVPPRPPAGPRASRHINASLQLISER